MPKGMNKINQYVIRYSAKGKNTGVVIVLILFMFSMSGCGDTCTTTTSYTTFKPLYASMSQLRQEIEVLPPQPMDAQGKIYIYGNYLFLGELGKGIHVFDNSDKTNPIAISFINIPGNVDMAVKDDKLFTDSYIDLVVFDISDPSNISFANRVKDAFPLYNNQFGVYEVDDLVVTSLEEQDVVEVSSDCAESNTAIFFAGRTEDIAIQTATLASTNNLSIAPAVGIGGSMARFTVVGDYLYTVDDYQMHVFDILNASNPMELAIVEIGWQIETIFPYKENLFIGSKSGMFVYNISNPESPTYKTSVSHINTCDPVVANDDYAFVTLRAENNGNWCGTAFTNQLDVIDISDIDNAYLLHSFTMNSPYGLGLDGNTLFVTEGDLGLKIYDIKDVSKIDENLIQHMKGFNAYDVIPNNGTLILTGSDGLYQFDYTNINEVKLLSLIQTGI